MSRNQSSPPSTSEMVDEVLFFPIAVVVSATIFPGFVLCVPGLIFVAAFVLIPLAVIAVVVLVIAAPVVLGRRAVHAVRERRAESRHLPRALQPVGLEG